MNGSGGNVAISGGTVTAVRGLISWIANPNHEAIGRGYNGAASGALAIPGMRVYGSETAAEAGTPVPAAERLAACRGSWAKLELCDPHTDSDSDEVCDHCGKLTFPVTYLDPMDEEEPVKPCERYTVLSDETLLEDGEWYVVHGSVNLTDRITVDGTVNLILLDRAALTANGGVNVAEGKHLIIWAQSDAVPTNSTDVGSLEIGVGLKVRAGTKASTAETAPAAERVTKCRENPWAKIELCSSHSYGEPSYAWAEDEHVDGVYICTAKLTCTFCLNAVSEEAAGTGETTLAPNCTEPGETTYTAVFTNPAFEIQTMTLADIPALGHALIHHEAQAPTCTEIGWAAYDSCSRCDYTTYVEEAALGHIWGEAEYVWEEDFSSVRATAHCTRNPEHELTETVTPTFYIVTPSTFETTGAGYYLAVFEDEHFANQRFDVEIPVVACEGGETCPGSRFTDMPPVTNYAHIPIDWAVVNHITGGTSPTTFSPKQTVTRAQVVTFLWAVKGKPEPVTQESPFTDVKPGKYYYKPVLWAVENHITGGVTATTFGPKQVCTRAQVVTFLWTFKGKPEPTVEENPFTDVTAGKYYYKPVLWAVENHITGGVTPTNYGPKQLCTRAQVVTFLYKTFGS